VTGPDISEDDDRTETAKRLLLELLDDELALVKPEAIARLAERYSTAAIPATSTPTSQAAPCRSCD